MAGPEARVAGNGEFRKFKDGESERSPLLVEAILTRLSFFCEPGSSATYSLLVFLLETSLLCESLS